MQSQTGAISTESSSNKSKFKIIPKPAHHISSKSKYIPKIQPSISDRINKLGEEILLLEIKKKAFETQLNNYEKGIKRDELALEIQYMEQKLDKMKTEYQMLKEKNTLME
jgi:hypothetical protein